LKRSQKKARPKNDDHWLYLCHDNTGALLYVGITSSGIKRFRNHGDVTDWWKDVDHIIVKHFETRNEAEVCERLAIRDLEPKHNIQLIPREKPKGKPWPENVVPLPNASRRRPAS
jgi:predicted GIY-YIG superfamily endonuclease